MKTAKNLKGFTLIEMLIYIAIFAIAAGLLIGILSTVTRVQNRETAAAEVSQQLEFVMQNIQRYVRESSNIDIPPGIATSTLKLRTNNSSTDPILIFANASNTAIYIQQGTGASTTLTSNRVTIGNFSVTKYENPSGHATIQLDMTLNYNSANAPLFTNVSRSLSTAIARVSAATFDSDLIPNADNTFSVGQTLNRWKNAFFDKIAIGTTTITNLFQVATAIPILTVVNTGNVGIGTNTPLAKLHIVRSAGTESIFIDSNAGNSSGGSIQWQNSGVNRWLAYSSNNDLRFYDTTDRVTFQSGGNVGIGTTNPNNRIQVIDLINFNNSSSGTFLGYQAGATSTGIRNSFIGYQAGFSNTTGYSNTAIGVDALYSNTIGVVNTANGVYALYSNTTGTFNTANGADALHYNTTGSNNTANGVYALYSNTTGNFNTASGLNALYDLGSAQTAGAFNVGTSYTIATVGTTDFTLIGAASNTVGVVFTATGAGSGTGKATPNSTNNNTAIGYNTGRGIIYGANNTIIGADVTGLPAGLSNNIIIADGAGNRRINVDSTGNVGIGTSTPAGALHINTNTAGTTYLYLSDPTERWYMSIDTGGNFIIRAVSNNETPFAIQRGVSPKINIGGTDFIGKLTVSTGGISGVPDLSLGLGGAGINAASMAFTSYNTNVIQAYASSTNPGSLSLNSSGGNVGIGTSTPQSTLHVVGNYIQFPTISGANPAATDCDATSEAGRMIIRTDGTASTTLWVCKGTGGWQGF